MPPAGPWSEAALERLESDAVRRVREMHARYQATGRSNELPYDKRPGGIQSLPDTDDISLAVGLPDEDSVPRQVLEDCMREGAFASADRSMWGYRGGTAGWEPLRAALAEHFTRRRGHPVAATNLMIDGGSGGAIASVVRAFLSPGDVVLAERPSYTTTFHCFEAVGARVVGVDLDGEGPVLAQIEEAHRALQAQGGSTPKLLYTQGLYHNPRGKGYSERRMRQLLQLCRRLGLLICNDEAYYGLDLGSGDDQQQPMSALEGSEGVLTCGTFSKTVAPGLRVGWVLGHEALVQRCDLLRFDNGISTVLLAGLAVFVSEGLWDAQIDKVQKLYRRKMLAFTGALREHCADFLSFQEPREEPKPCPCCLVIAALLASAALHLRRWRFLHLG